MQKHYTRVVRGQIPSVRVERQSAQAKVTLVYPFSLADNFILHTVFPVISHITLHCPAFNSGSSHPRPHP